MMKKIVLITLLAVIAPLYAANNPYEIPQGSWVNMNIFSYFDPDNVLDSIRTFDIMLTTDSNPMLQKQLLYAARDTLIAKGFTLDKDNPDVLVSLSYYIGSVKEYVPPQTYLYTAYRPGRSLYYYGGYFGGIVSEPGSIELEKETTEAYAKNSYFRKIELLIFDGEKAATQDSLVLIWKGAGESTGGSPEIRMVSSPILSELCDEFPQPSGKPTFRTYNPHNVVSVAERNAQAVKAYKSLQAFYLFVSFISLMWLLTL